MKRVLILTQLYTFLLLTCGTRTMQKKSNQPTMKKDVVAKKHFGYDYKKDKMIEFISIKYYLAIFVRNLKLLLKTFFVLFDRQIFIQDIIITNQIMMMMIIHHRLQRVIMKKFV